MAYYKTGPGLQGSTNTTIAYTGTGYGFTHGTGLWEDLRLVLLELDFHYRVNTLGSIADIGEDF